MRGEMTVQIPGPKFQNMGDSRSWGFRYEAHGLEYMQQNAHTGEIFIGGGFLRATNGGLDEIGNADDREKDAAAQEYLAGVLPAFFGPEHWGADVAEKRVKSSWSGVMGYTPDGFPVVGRLSEKVTGRKKGHEWIAAGFNGEGMVNCWLSAKALAMYMLGEDPSAFLPEQYLASDERLDALGPQVFVDRLTSG